MTCVVFATCERRRALSFIQKLYPGREVKDEGAVSNVLDFVEADMIRIGDPEFHGGQVFEGAKSGLAAAVPALKAMHAELMASMKSEISDL